jgi:hypothetical protein
MHENAHILHSAPHGYVTYSDGTSIKTRRTTNRSVFLLAAFSLENLIKAYLVYENPHYIERGRLSKRLLNGHGLSKLQKECKKIPSPKRTRHVFETLEVGINSWARYPCSTSESASLRREQLLRSSGLLITKYSSYTVEGWKSYFQRNGKAHMVRLGMLTLASEPNSSVGN